jgi:hypothetical protein
LKGKTKILRQKKNIKTIFVCLVSALVLSLLFRATTLYNYEQENMNIPNITPQSSNGNAPEQHWNRTWGGIGNDSAIDISLDSSNNIYITGIYNVSSEPVAGISASKNIVAQPPPGYGGYIVLLKYDSSGEYQWNKTWVNCDYSRAIAVDSSDNIYLVGRSTEGDVVFLKYDSSGELLWDKSWSNNSAAMAITLDSVGNIYITGTQTGSMILWKYNSLGVYQWERTWNNISFRSDGWGIIADSSNNIYVTGLIFEYIDNTYNLNLFLVKYDSSGTLQWNTTWGGSEFEDAHSIAIDSSNNILVAGETSSYGAGSYDLSLVVFDSSGDLQWNTTWGGNESEGGWDMLTLDKSGNIYLGASTSSFGAGLSDGVLVKFNSTGQQQWNTTWGGSGDDGFGAIIIDSSDNIFLTGKTESFGAGGNDIVLVKYSHSITPDDGFAISGYEIFSLFSAMGLISIIIIKKWRKTTIS